MGDLKCPECDGEEISGEFECLLITLWPELPWDRSDRPRHLHPSLLISFFLFVDSVFGDRTDLLVDDMDVHALGSNEEHGTDDMNPGHKRPKPVGSLEQ